MAAVVLGVTAANTGNNAALTTGSFTPAAGDLLIAFCGATGQGLSGTVTDSQGLGWTNVAQADKNTNADRMIAAIANAPAAASAMTVTYTPAGSPTSTGVVIIVQRVSGMKRFGASAIRKLSTLINRATQDNQ